MKTKLCLNVHIILFIIFYNRMFYKVLELQKKNYLYSHLETVPKFVYNKGKLILPLYYTC